MSEIARTNIEDITSLDLFQVCSTLESAHEPSDINKATNKLSSWGLTLQDCATELKQRGVFK